LYLQFWLDVQTGETNLLFDGDDEDG